MYVINSFTAGSKQSVSAREGEREMKWSRRMAATVGLTGALLAATGAVAAAPVGADTQTTATYFVCPSTSLNNSNGMWVIGQHGAYYVLVPTQGNTGSKVYLTIPVRVFSQAEIPAGWALYSSLPSYPTFVGGAGILSEGITRWLSGAAGFDATQWAEGDMVMVSSNGNGTYMVADMRSGAWVTIDYPIPLASAAVW
jgi:hypothetical protein